jgi:two-component system, NtrC family, sensor histidine kinase HupT/HoxJ
MASLGRLVAGVAHELNNPISFVLGNVHALQKYAERLRRYIEAFHAHQDTTALREELRIDRILDDTPSLIAGTVEGAERTRDIVDGLKCFSALDLAEGSAVNLSEVLERAVLWVSKASPSSFRVKKNWPEKLPVEGSAGQLQQVLMNLVQNARDATKELPNGQVTISGHVEGTQIVLEFHDNGPGIAAEDLPHLFDPFFTTKPVGQGTGLGLAISYTIVERHGGKLTAANHPMGGAQFTLCLPTAKTK